MERTRVGDLVGGAEIMSESDCWNLLASLTVGHVAVATRAGVELFPINFWVDHGIIVFATNFGRKLAGLLDGQVVFEAERVDEATHTGASVVVHGSADVVELDLDDLPPQQGPWTGMKRYEVRLTPSTVTGRRIGLVS